jgi:ribosome maturation factor RimP
LEEAAMGTDNGRLQAIVTEVTGAHGYDLEELTARTVGRRTVVRVVIDADDGVSLDDAAEVSREISARLDEPDDPMGELPYTLEVTSPGVGRPLREPRHFRRSRGRLLAVTTAQGQQTGHLLRAGDRGIELLVTGKKGVVSTIEVTYDQITAAKVEVEFGAPPAAVQELLDQEGVTR